MLKYIDKIFIVFIMMFAPMILVAQTNEETNESDSVKIEFELMPKGVRLGMDLVGTIRTFSEADHNELDFSGDIAIHHFLINVDYGILQKGRTGELIDYTTKGSYFRAGIDFNVLKKDPDGNAFFFGVKYGRGVSDHTIEYTYLDSLFGDHSGQREFNAVKTQWFELNSGVKVKLFWEIWAGFTGRLKFAPKIDKSSELKPYELPGFGFADRKFNWGFDYYLFYRIPFSKKE